MGSENGISGDNPKAMYLGRGNDHAITGLLVDRGQPVSLATEKNG
jgi:hypothetical protein